MKFNKDVWIIFGVILVDVLAMMKVIPFERTAVWWIAAVCTIVMFAVCAYSVFLAFKNDEKTKSKLLGWAIFKVGYVMLAVQIVVGFILMGTAKFCPMFAALIVEVLIYAATAIGLIVKRTARDYVTQNEAKIEEKTGEWRKMRVAMISMASTGNDDLKKLAEEMYYADPTPTAMDAEISDVIEALKDDTDNAALLSQLKDLLARRKSAAKAGKIKR